MDYQSPREAQEESDRVERISARRLWNVTRVLAFGIIILVVVVIGFAMQIGQRQDQIDKTGEQVEELRTFATDLQEISPEEQAQNEAISQAVQQVPEIRSILCEQFPTANACEGP